MESTCVSERAGAAYEERIHIDSRFSQRPIFAASLWEYIHQDRDMTEDVNYQNRSSTILGVVVVQRIIIAHSDSVLSLRL
jgi:hypothetical protein